MYKVAALATNSLRASGIPNARQHLIVVATGERVGESAPGVATLLMKRTPFTEAEVTTIEDVAEEMNFDAHAHATGRRRRGLCGAGGRAEDRRVRGHVYGRRSVVSRPTIDRFSSRWTRAC